MNKINNESLKNKIKSFSSLTRKFLTVNKIFFETILMLIVSIAGICVSYSGVKISSIEKDISLREQYIEDIEKQPVFSCNSALENNKLHYIVVPVSGEIKGGNARFQESIIASFLNTKNNHIMQIELILPYSNNPNNKYYSFSEYNYKNNNFNLLVSKDKLDPTTLGDEIFSFIKNLINQNYNSSYAFISCTYHECITISYYDYKREEHIVRYDLYMSDLNGTNYILTEKMNIPQFQEHIPEDLNLKDSKFESTIKNDIGIILSTK